MTQKKHSLKQPHSRFPLTDWQLHLVLLASVLVGVCFWFILPQSFAAHIIASPLLLLNVLLLYPVVEELLFRGVIQRTLLHYPTLAKPKLGISLANCTTSALFASLHLVNQPPIWAMAVLFPSVVLGYFFERYQSVKLPILLHVFFNTIFVLAGA